MTQRYFVESTITGSRALVTDSEAHHLLHVMRVKPGAEVVLFDGSGAEFAARVDTVGRTEVELQVLSRHEVDRELSVAITLGVALPKGDRQRWLVEKAAELGVQCLVPLETHRGVAQPTDAALGRLRRAVIEASKQSGRNRLMEVSAPIDWSTFTASAPPSAPESDVAGRFVAHPRGKAAATQLAEARSLSAVQLAVGPEGGFTDTEIECAGDHGWQTVDLGPRILRIETAALAMATLVALR